jgi:hypothetical protein
MNAARKYAAPNVVLFVAPDGTGQLINIGSGSGPLPVNRTMTELWRLLDEQGMNLSTATEMLAVTYDRTVAAIRRDCAPAVADLQRARMLTRCHRQGRLRRRVASDAPPPRRRVVAVATEEDEPAPASYRAAAWAGYMIGLVLRCLPYRITLWTMLAARSMRAQRPTEASTRQLGAIARRLVHRGPGWAECHEVSVAAYLAAAVIGRAPRWVLDATLPFRLHAYLQVGDTAVDDAAPAGGLRQVLIRI